MSDVLDSPSAKALPNYTLGVILRDIAYQDQFGYTQAVQIINLISGSPAQRAGLEIRDVITRINGTRVLNRADYAVAMNESNGTATLRIKDSRTGAYLTRGPISLDLSNLSGGSSNDIGP